MVHDHQPRGWGGPSVTGAKVSRGSVATSSYPCRTIRRVSSISRSCIFIAITNYLRSKSVLERYGRSCSSSDSYYGVKAQAASSAPSIESAPTTERYRSSSDCCIQSAKTPSFQSRSCSSNLRSSKLQRVPSTSGGLEPGPGRCRYWLRAKKDQLSGAKDAICTQSGGFGLEDLELNQSGYAQRCNRCHSGRARRWSDTLPSLRAWPPSNCSQARSLVPPSMYDLASSRCFDPPRKRYAVHAPRYVPC